MRKMRSIGRSVIEIDFHDSGAQQDIRRKKGRLMTCAIAAPIIRIINIMTNYSQSNKCVKFDVTIFTLDESPKVTPFALMSDTADAVKVIVCGSP